MAELDNGAASVYIGVDHCYQNYANETEMPIVTPAEVAALVANGTLEVIRVEDADDLENVGVIAGSGETEEPVMTEPVAMTPVVAPVEPVVSTQGPLLSDF